MKIWKHLGLESLLFGHNKAKNAQKFQKLKMGAHKRHIDGKLEGEGALTGLKKGGS